MTTQNVWLENEGSPLAGAEEERLRLTDGVLDPHAALERLRALDLHGEGL